MPPPDILVAAFIYSDLGLLHRIRRFLFFFGQRSGLFAAQSARAMRGAGQLRLGPGGNHIARYMAGGHIVLARQIKHGIQQRFFDDRAQAARAALLLHRHVRDGRQRVLIEGEGHAVQLQELGILLNQRVARLGQDAYQRRFIQLIQRCLLYTSPSPRD